MKQLELFYPYKPYILGQPFGASLACTEDNNLPLMQRKVVSKVGGVCPIGYVELYPLLGMKGHTGQDLYAPDGVLLRAPFDGVVKEVQTEVERGLGVGIITHDKRNLGQYGEHYVKVRQWHLKEIFVSPNQVLKVGDPIGRADNTGLSAGSHNHLEIKAVEYSLDGSYYNVFQNNGFYGSLDPAPYWSGVFAEDYASISNQLRLIAVKVAELLSVFFKK